MVTELLEVTNISLLLVVYIKSPFITVPPLNVNNVDVVPLDCDISKEYIIPVDEPTINIVSELPENVIPALLLLKPATVGMTYDGCNTELYGVPVNSRIDN